MNKTINGFDIEQRELTDEERGREITLERFTEFHFAAGEDFLDQTGEGNVKIFAGWMLHKYPEFSVEILSLANDKNAEVMTFNELEEKTYTDLYADFAEFCNQTGALKHRVNQILIQVVEYYDD